MGTTNIKIL